jgi:MerR family transcriptional regulator, repressor of the yfmOP operon
MKSDRSNFLKIGEIARLTEMSPRTIRYYEEIGLLNSVKRVQGGKRVYTDKDLQRLKFIKRLKHLGLALSEMTELEGIYQVDRTNRKVLPRLMELMEGHVLKIDERINNLVRLKSDILTYQEKIREKMKTEEGTQK